MQVRKNVLALSIVAALGVSGIATAQDKPSDPQAKDLDAVVVTGIRGSIEKALDAKKDAATHVEVVTSEDVGKLPAKNVADTLRQLPGVNIASSSASEGGFDEADRVSLRGTNPSLTQTLVNGHTVGTGDWFVLSQVANVGRSVSYSLFPSEIVDRVVVHKSSQAKLVEGGSAGSVNIVTRRPLQFSEPLTLQGSLGTVYSDLPGDSKPQFDALFNWHNAAGTAGVMVQGFYEKRSLRRDGQEVVGGYGSMVSSDPALNGALYPNLLGAVYFTQERERKGGVVDVEVRASDSLTLNLNAFYSELRADNYNRNYMMWTSHFANQTPTSYTVQNGVLTSATFAPDAADAANSWGVYDMISRPGAKSTSRFVALDADWQPSEALGFKFQLGTTKGNGSSPTQDVLETGVAGGAGASWTMHGVGKPIDWALGGTNTPANHMPQNGWIFGGQGIDVLDKEDWASADGTFYFGDGALSSLEFGFRHSSHERSNDFEIAQGPNWATNWTDISAYPTTGGAYPGDFGNGIGGSVPGNIWFYTPEQLAQINAQFANRNNPERFYFSDVYSVKESINAAYAQLNFSGDRWAGNVGVRYVRTGTDVGYTQALPVASGLPGAITGSAFGDYLPVVANNDYNEFLPSASLRFNLSDALVARFSASKTMTRPDYSALAGSLSLDDLTHTGSGGNPNLKPLVSTNFDASLEWYFAPRALLAASVYSMDLDDYINFGTTTIQYKDQQASHASGTDVYNDYLVSIPVNAHGTVKGFELTYEQPIGENFGVSANYTYADGEADGGKPLNGTSRDTWNLSGWFENDRFNARLSYGYRSSFYAGVSRTDAFFQDDFSSLSASFGYRLTDALTLSLDALNLNNPTLKYYTEKAGYDGYLPYALYSNGRQYYLNLRFKF